MCGLAWLACRLQKLKVLSVEAGASEDEGFVAFQAWFKNQKQMGQRAQGFHTQTFVERSRFLRTEGGRWLYGERAPGAGSSLSSAAWRMLHVGHAPAPACTTVPLMNTLRSTCYS